MTVLERPSRLRGYLASSWRILLKELSAFGVIGGLAFVIDLGIFTWLTHLSHDNWFHGALKAKCVSTVVSTTFAYFGNKHWSFSHRARTSLGREALSFFGINGVTLAISELVLAFFVYVLDYNHASTMIFVVNILTIGLGTVFRFWAYKRFVFLHPDRVHEHDVDLESELAE